MSILGFNFLWNEIKDLPRFGKLVLAVIVAAVLLFAANGLSNGLESYRRHRADKRQEKLEGENSELTRQRDGLRERATAAEARARLIEEKTAYTQAQLEQEKGKLKSELEKAYLENGNCARLADVGKREQCVRAKLAALFPD